MNTTCTEALATTTVPLAECFGEGAVALIDDCAAASAKFLGLTPEQLTAFTTPYKAIHKACTAIATEV